MRRKHGILPAVVKPTTWRHVVKACAGHEISVGALLLLSLSVSISMFRRKLWCFVQLLLCSCTHEKEFVPDEIKLLICYLNLYLINCPFSAKSLSEKAILRDSLVARWSLSVIERIYDNLTYNNYEGFVTLWSSCVRYCFQGKLRVCMEVSQQTLRIVTFAYWSIFSLSRWYFVAETLKCSSVYT